MADSDRVRLGDDGVGSGAVACQRLGCAEGRQCGVYGGRVLSLDEIRAIGDPVERVKAARERDDALMAERAAVAGVVRGAVQEMRRTMTYGQVAAALGVSRTRVQQLEKNPS